METECSPTKTNDPGSTKQDQEIHLDDVQITFEDTTSPPKSPQHAEISPPKPEIPEFADLANLSLGDRPGDPPSLVTVEDLPTISEPATFIGTPGTQATPPSTPGRTPRRGSHPPPPPSTPPPTGPASRPTTPRSASSSPSTPVSGPRPPPPPPPPFPPGAGLTPGRLSPTGPGTGMHASSSSSPSTPAGQASSRSSSPFGDIVLEGTHPFALPPDIQRSIRAATPPRQIPVGRHRRAPSTPTDSLHASELYAIPESPAMSNGVTTTTTTTTTTAAMASRPTSPGRARSVPRERPTSSLRSRTDTAVYAADDDRAVSPGRARRRKKAWKKKQGEDIKRGHVSYHTMLNMQLGIRMTVGLITPRPPKHFLSGADFTETVKLVLPRLGSSSTPPHQSYDFKFKDYAPMVFRHLREKFNCDAADYMVSLCGDRALATLRTPGKSSSAFFYSHCGSYVIKTMSQSESRYLRKILPGYYEHVMRNPHTILTRFFGLHRVKSYKSSRHTYFLVMGNIFDTPLLLHEVFDLKGSSVGRHATEKELQRTPCILKDLDFTHRLNFGEARKRALMQQLRSDTDFLAKNKIMDYSLLLGIHYRSIGGSMRTQSPARTIPRIPTPFLDFQQIDITSHPGFVGPKGTHLSLFRAEDGGISTVDPTTGQPPGEFVVCIGLIDLLQKYNARKQLEHFFKSMRYKGNQISAVKPRQYARRFLEYMEAHLV